MIQTLNSVVLFDYALAYACASNPFKLFLQLPSMSKQHKILRQTALECHMELVRSTAAGVLYS